MTTQEQKALELALEGGGLYEITGRIEDIDKCIVHRSVIKEALAVDKESLTTEAQQSNEQGCEHCNHSLYCGTKCKNCGKQSNEQVEPVAWYDTEEYGNIRWASEWSLDEGTPLYTHPPVPTAQPKEPEQEPVAWMYPDALCDRSCLYVCTKAFTQFPECATTPPQRKPLTDAQIKDALADMSELQMPFNKLIPAIARAIEAAHGIKENA